MEGPILETVAEPTPRDTEVRDLVTERLASLLRTVTDAELDHLAHADPTAGPIKVKKHEAALRTIIFKRGGQMTAKHTRFPGEAINHIAEAGGPQPGRAFEIASAILMINALTTRDDDGTMSVCWAENWPDYLDADREFVVPLLSGFRWLAENAVEWTYLHDPETVVPVPDWPEVTRIMRKLPANAEAPASPREPLPQMG